MNLRILTRLALMVLLCTNYAIAQQVTLVKDITPGTGSTFDDDDEGIVATLGSKALFELKNSAGDWELWASDGTDAGTILLKTFDVGQTPTRYWHHNGELLVFVNKADNGEIWRTDGTVAGTNLIYAHPNQMTFPALIGEYIYFGTDEGFTGDKLWRINLANPMVEDMFLFDNFGGIMDMEPLNDSILIIIGADISTPTNTIQLFVSNTQSGMTQPIYQLSTGSVVGQGLALMTSVGGRMFFFYKKPGPEYSLYSTDGTTQGTINLGQYNELNSSTNYLKAIRAVYGWNNKFFFRGRNLSNPIQNKDRLYVSDGTLAGTIQLDPIADEALRPSYLTEYKGELYFSGDFADAYVFGIFKTNGTQAGTQELINGSGLGGGSGTFGGDYMTVFNDSLFFSANRSETGVELWVSDGTTSGTRVIELEAGDGDAFPEDIMKADSLLFFTATTTSNGRELYVLKYPDCSDQILNLDETICEGESIEFGGMVYTQAGTYQASYPLGSGCDSVVVLNLAVSALPTVELGPDTTILESESLLLSINAAGNTVLWSDGSSSSSLLFDASEYGLGTHQITVTLTNSEGCQYTDVITITVEEDVPTNQVIDKLIAVEVNPNPVEKNKTVSCSFTNWEQSDYRELSYRIIDASGQLQFEGKMDIASPTPLKFTLPTSGVFYLCFYSEKHQILSKKIVAY